MCFLVWYGQRNCLLTKEARSFPGNPLARSCDAYFVTNSFYGHLWDYTEQKDMVPAFRRTGFQYSRENLGFGVVLGLNSTFLLLIVGNLFFFFYFLSGYGNTYLVRLLGGWSKGILCLSNSSSVWIFPSFHLFNSNLSSRKNQQGLESRTIETSSPPLIWRDFGWDSGDLGDQALKDFMKESVVGLRRHFSKAADSPLKFTVKLEKPS